MIYLKDMTLEELLQFEKATRLVVKKHENEAYYCKLNGFDSKSNDNEKEYIRYSKIHELICDELRNRIDKIVVE